jgi:NADPH-dependent 2,4-dienoyl-CoA reductase/sulfur reductase-like enzyme
MHVLRVPADAERLSNAMSSAGNMVIIGGGYIGLEVAASAKQRGLEVTVVEMASRLLARVASPEVSQYFNDLHESHGTTIKTSCKVGAITPREDGIVLALGDGEMTADLVLVGIGVIPDMALIEALEIETGNGILVDSQYATGIEGVWAIGDVALPSGGYTDGAMRVESVHHAQMSAEIAAAALTGGQPKAHEVPWFWSEQYDKKLQSAGLYQSDAEVISRVGKREGAVSFWAFSGDRMISVEAINDPQAFTVGKNLLSDGKSLTKDELANPDFELKDALKR